MWNLFCSSFTLGRSYIYTIWATLVQGQISQAYKLSLATFLHSDFQSVSTKLPPTTQYRSHNMVVNRAPAITVPSKCHPQCISCHMPVGTHRKLLQQQM